MPAVKGGEPREEEGEAAAASRRVLSHGRSGRGSASAAGAEPWWRWRDGGPEVDDGGVGGHGGLQRSVEREREKGGRDEEEESGAVGGGGGRRGWSWAAAVTRRRERGRVLSPR